LVSGRMVRAKVSYRNSQNGLIALLLEWWTYEEEAWLVGACKVQFEEAGAASDDGTHDPAVVVAGVEDDSDGKAEELVHSLQ
jgi:hypothetical protein